MKSRRNFTDLVVVLLALSPLVCLFILWDSIPEMVRMRFNLNEPVVKEERKQNLIVVAVVLSVIAAGIYLLMRNIKRVDPKVKEHTPVSGFNRIGLLVVVLLTVLNYFFIFSAVYSWEVSEKALYVFGGLLFALLGNYMSNIKPNFFAGIRLPWTLNDENNWRQTHHLAGKLWFAGGILLALLAWLLPQSIIRPVFISILVLMVLIPGIYSYRLFKAKN